MRPGGLRDDREAGAIAEYEADEKAGIGRIVDDHDAYGLHPAGHPNP